MWLYLTTFVFSTFLFFVSENNQIRNFDKVFALCGIIIPSLVAGFRAATVGTDLSIYGIRFYNCAYESRNFGDLVSILNSTGEKNDIGFHMINYILSRFSNNYHLGLFFYSFIAISCVYFAMKKLNKLYRISIWPGMLCYFFALYNFSLNGMKQSIAIAIVFLAITFLIEKNYKAYLILSMIAYFFHGSALITIPILFLYLILRDSKVKISSRKLYGVLFALVMMLIIAVYLRSITNTLSQIGLTRSEYMFYLKGGQFTQNNGIDIWTSGLLFIFLFIDLIFYKKSNVLISDNTFFVFLMLLGFMTSIATIIASYLGRINLYFTMINIAYQLILVSHFDSKSKNIFTFIIIILVFVVWLHNIVLLNYNTTLPYIFSLN